MIKRLLLTLFLMLSPLIGHASLLDVKISPAQIFDVQWNIQGTTFNASNFTRPFYSVNPNGSSCSWCQMTTAQVQAVAANNQYFGFFASTTNPGTYGLAVYNSDGSIAWVLHNTGSIRALSPDVIFYNGNNFWGTVISVTEGFNYGASKSWTDIINNPTQEQINNYIPGATQPLAAGETATASSPPPPPTPVYRSSAITSQQATSRSNNLSETTGHNSQIIITGDGNDVYILQAGSNGHYTSVSITGDTNNIDVTQTSTVGARHYLESSIIGSSNIVNLTQRDSAKTQIVTVIGSSNNVTTNQRGTGNHFLDLSVTGNNHTASVVQDGSGNHEARVLLDGQQPWNFNLTQDGSISRRYSLPHDMSDGSAVNGTCSIIGGCNLTINQNN
jgi:hypothetical protein